MKYVFYDFETTGLSSAFDSIVQAAAISTDENFNIIDQFDLRGQMKINQKTRLNDLSLLCSNCHKMIHRKSPWLTIEQLKKILR